MHEQSERIRAAATRMRHIARDPAVTQRTLDQRRISDDHFRVVVLVFSRFTWAEPLAEQPMNFDG